MAVRIQVVAAAHKEGVGAASKKAYSMDVLQAVVINGSDVFVGELMLPKGHAPCPPGFYSVEYSMGRTADGKVQARIGALIPIKG